MSKIILNARRIFPIDLYLHGCNFDEFVLGVKHQISRDFINIAGERTFSGRFAVEDLTDYEVWEQIYSCQRADGQYVVNGEFTPSETIEKIVRANCKAVVFNGYAERGDEDG